MPDAKNDIDWSDASVAYDQVKEGNAKGNTAALWLRGKVQALLFRLGCFIQRNDWLVLAIFLGVLALCGVGLTKARIELSVDKLWVEEGGRLDAEIAYSRSQGQAEGAVPADQGDTSIGTSGPQLEVVTQTTKDGRNILNQKSLLLHAKAIQAVAGVSVNMYGQTWSFNDICEKAGVPKFEVELVDNLIQQLNPCIVVSPLDCFWEASKHISSGEISILGGVKKYNWKILNPTELLVTLQSLAVFGITVDMEQVRKVFDLAGIDTGYVFKPCLNPNDTECPATAPNKQSGSIPDVPAAMKGGCTGFARKLAKWPEGMIMGGIKSDGMGDTQSAEALQTIIQVQSDISIHNAYKGKDKVKDIEWDQTKAFNIRVAWERKFQKTVGEIQSGDDSFQGMAYNAIDDILEEYSKASTWRIAVGYALMLVYACVSLVRWKDCVHSQGALAVGGVLLVMLSVVAGLGICSVGGIQLNAATTQVIPFLALGLGVDDMFIISHWFSVAASGRRFPYDHTVGECLRSVGMTVILTSLSNATAFFLAAIIPIPALRAFSLQAAVLVLFNVFSMIFAFSAMVSLDLRRQKRNLSDMLFCIPCTGEVDAQEKEKTSPPDRCTFSLNYFAKKYYAPFLLRLPVKLLSLLLLGGLLGASAWGITTIKDGLDVTDVIPKDTPENRFIEVQTNYFGFYPIFIITKTLDYPNSQNLLHSLHRDVSSLPQIALFNDTLPDTWLTLYHDWLRDVQAAVDKDVAGSQLTSSGWAPGRSVYGELGYKLTVQTGDANDPINKTLFPATRLVDGEGTINPAGFYSYMAAWYEEDFLRFFASQNGLTPTPTKYSFEKGNTNLSIPISAPFTYTRMAYYATRITNTETIVKFIEDVRAICENYTQQGLPSYPSGIPFTFWEQYIKLRYWLAISLVCVLAAIFVMVSLFLMSIWAGLVVVFVLAVMLVETFGFMGFIGIKLSAIPAVTLVVSVGIGVEFVLHIIMVFLTSTGDRQERVQQALEHMFAPVIHGGVSTLIGVVMFATSPFEFIIKYFFAMLAYLIVLGYVNGLVLLPILLSFLGPTAYVNPEMAVIGVNGTYKSKEMEAESSKDVNDLPMSRVSSPEENGKPNLAYTHDAD